VFDFTGKAAIVTGGGGGIGRAAAVALAKAGAKVAVVDIARDPAGETVQLIKDQGGQAMFVAADVTKSAEIENYVKETVAAYGRIDVFMNNAGWEGVVKPIPEYPEDLFDKVLAINVRGAFLGLKHVLPVMIAQKSGAVVNTASGAGYMGSPGMVAYIASKHAVLGITKVAALEVAKLGIRVNAVCPGPVNTRMMRSLEEGFAPGAGQAAQKQMAEAIPDGRYAEPQEIANLMLYLASDMSTHITGQGVLIDGGQIMR
jgi:3alpha(or 20beta)-hydroxysteroid dehydrogenase